MKRPSIGITEGSKDSRKQRCRRRASKRVELWYYRLFSWVYWPGKVPNILSIVSLVIILWLPGADETQIANTLADANLFVVLLLGTANLIVL
jgi:hypothetical protein